MTRTDADSPLALPPAWGVAAYVVAALLAATVAPLWAYAGSLALFGTAHTLTELRYVDGRFGRRLGGLQGLAVLALLGGVVLVRWLVIQGSVAPSNAYLLELGFVAVLAFVVVPRLAERPGWALLAVGLGAALALGSAVDPWTTLVVLAVLHNLTPVGFLAERLAGRPERAAVLWVCAVIFLLLPGLLAAGLPQQAVAALGVARHDGGFGSTGALGGHLLVFVPTAWISSDFGLALFQAAAFLQLLHYGVVIGVLPRLLGTRGSVGNRPLLPWPRASVLALLIAAVGAVAVVLFVNDFQGTRAHYGLLAAVHAWIEIPVLLLALVPWRAAAPVASAASCA